jgi:hypothetical protein
MDSMDAVYFTISVWVACIVDKLVYELKLFGGGRWKRFQYFLLPKIVCYQFYVL